MNRFCFSTVVGVGLIFLAHSASAQSPPTKPRASVDTAERNKSDAKTEAERPAKERQSQARSLLISLASDARSFHDQKLRARCLSQIADVLWKVDVEQGRTLFRQAWEAAETADREDQSHYQIGQGPPNLRGEVLKLAARRDRQLAEEFLQKLKADQQETKRERAESSLWALSDALEQRLRLAESLLRTGDIDRALQFADPVLGNVTISTLEFLTLLREKDAAAADQRYAAMLVNTGGNISADANTISLLSSYIFTPHMYVVFNTAGAASSVVPYALAPAARVSPQLRLVFFRTAAGVFLRPLPPPEQDQSTTGVAGKYMVVRRLMPLFEQYAPNEITEAIRGQFEVLNSLVANDVRQRENDWTQKGISPEKSVADQEQPMLDQIERARTSAERDELYFRLALLAVRRDDLGARDYVSKIDESDFRKRAEAFIDWGLAIGAIRKKAAETALELARKGELTHIQRVWILTQSAKLLAKTDREKALSLLDDATSEAHRIDGVDLDRPRGLLAIANALEVIEPARAWDAIFDVVKAANSTEGFAGEDAVLSVTMNTRSQAMTKLETNPDFEIKGIFSEVASNDYDRAVQLARGFQSEAPRANATIAIARSVLDEKRAPVSMPQPVTKN